MRSVPPESGVPSAPSLGTDDCAECRTGSLKDHLSGLMGPISRGSRDAFVTLFDHTRDAIRAGIGSRLPDPRCAAAVFAATYVEVWWLAGCNTGPDADVLAWIDRIAERRSTEAQPNPPGDDALGPQHLRAVLELSSLLGRPVDPLTNLDPGRC